MKRTFIGLFLIVTLILAGTAFAEKITIVGTGSGMSILEDVGSAFSKKFPAVSVEVPKSIGSGGGIKAVGTDQAVIGRIARELKDKEKPYGLSYIPMAKMPIIFFVNPSVGIENLTPKQACDIYSGKITNWKEVGGKDAKIRVVRREDGDSSLKVLQTQLPGFKDITITEKSKTTDSDSKNCQFIEAKADTIGFGAYSDAKNYKVSILKIDGKHPSESEYPYFGTLALIVKDKNKTGAIKDFVGFATSVDAHDAIKGSGGMPF